MPPAPICKVPALIVVVPMKVFEPVRVRVPAPVLVRGVGKVGGELEMVPATVRLPNISQVWPAVSASARLGSKVTPAPLPPREMPPDPMLNVLLEPVEKV